MGFICCRLAHVPTQTAHTASTDILKLKFMKKKFICEVNHCANIFSVVLGLRIVPEFSTSFEHSGVKQSGAEHRAEYRVHTFGVTHIGTAMACDDWIIGFVDRLNAVCFNFEICAKRICRSNERQGGAWGEIVLMTCWVLSSGEPFASTSIPKTMATTSLPSCANFACSNHDDDDYDDDTYALVRTKNFGNRRRF